MDEKKLPNEHHDNASKEVLLAYDGEHNQISAVSGVTGKGKLKTVAPQFANEAQFMRVDKHGDAFSNFYSNFLRQLKNPTRFLFFKVRLADVESKAAKLRMMADRLLSEQHLPESGDNNLKILRTNTIKNDSMETRPNNTPAADEFRYAPEQIDWATMNNMGLSRERLEKMNLLEPLLKGFKTNVLVPVTINLGSALTKTDARLSLQADDSGNVIVAVHGVRKEPNLNFEFFGHKFTAEDKKNLLETGNMGRVVDLDNLKTGEKIPSIISIDRLTNEIVALRTEQMKIPNEIKGVILDETQKQTLLQGAPLALEAMISKKGDSFSATLQYNADKRYVEFLFDRSKSQVQVEKQPVQPLLDAPRTFRGVELDNQQYEQLKTGQSVYIDGLVDRKGREYQGYITYDSATGKTEFSFPTQSKSQGKPEPSDQKKRDGSLENNAQPTKTSLQTQKSTQPKVEDAPAPSPEQPSPSKGRKL